MSDDNSNDNNYFYNASIPAAYIFSVVFGILTFLHIFQFFRYRTWYMIVLLAAVTMEFVGYPTRIISIKQPNSSWSVTVSQVFIIVSPAFVAAQDYMIVGRIMAYVGSEYAIIKHTRITKIFVASDVFAIMTQGLGGAIISGSNNNINTMKVAKDILLAGLSLQVITFGVFLFVAIYYHVKSKAAPALRPYAAEMRKMERLWVAFYVSGILITLRSIYRTIEFGNVNFTAGENDPQGYLITHEWPFYVFDAVPMSIAIFALNLAHPGMFLPQKKGWRMDGGWEEQPGRRRFLCCGRRKPGKPRPDTAPFSANQTANNSSIPLDPIYKA